MVAPNQMYAFDVENWDGVRANIQDIIESLPSTLYHDHELAASQKVLKPSVWNERHTQENLDCIPYDFEVLGSQQKDLKAQVVFLCLVSCDGNDYRKKGGFENKWLPMLMAF